MSRAQFMQIGQIIVRRQAPLKLRLIKLSQRRNNMLELIAIVLVVLWILGLITSYTMGGFIHVLLVIAVVMILLRLIRGRSL